MRSLDLTIFSDITKKKLLDRLASEPPLPQTPPPDPQDPLQGWQQGWGPGDVAAPMGTGSGNSFTGGPPESTAERDQDWNRKMNAARAQAAVDRVNRTTASKNASADAMNASRQLDIEARSDDLALQRARSRQSLLWGWLRMLACLLLGLLVAALAALLLYRAYRWCVEAPLIKEVVKQVVVEKPVERIVEKPVEKQVKVIPKECTQIRRNGEIYINCDGVTVKGGAHTVQESGVDKVPELLPDSRH